MVGHLSILAKDTYFTIELLYMRAVFNSQFPRLSGPQFPSHLAHRSFAHFEQRPLAYDSLALPDYSAWLLAKNLAFRLNSLRCNVLVANAAVESRERRVLDI